MGAAGIALVKLGTALVAAMACYRLSRGASRWASALLGLCAVFSVCAYFQFGHLPAGLVHRWEMFHYYVGSKYHAELGSKNLYRCTALADAEDGFAPGERRMLRDLDTDGLLSAVQAVAEPARCKASFSAGRWSAFKRDVGFFDHGYNPPPLWTATWDKLTELVPASLRHLQLLAAADVALMLGVATPRTSLRAPPRARLPSLLRLA